MLLKKEVQFVLRYIGVACKYAFLPVQVNVSRAELVPLSSWKYKFWFLVFLLNGMHIIVSFVRTYFSEEETPLHQLVLHFMMAVAAAMYSHWYFLMFFKYPDEFRAIFKMTMTGTMEALENQRKQPRMRRLKELSLHEIYILNLPCFQTCAVASITLAYVCYPSLSVLMYSSIPKEYQNWITWVILIFEDSRYLVVVAIIGMTMWVSQVMTFELFIHRLQLLSKSLQRTATERDLRRVYRTLRHIQLYMGISNMVYCYAIFACKVGLITICIITGYAAIAHFSDFPVFGVLNYVILFDGLFIYCFTYGRAFKISPLFQEASQRAVLQVQACGSRGMSEEDAKIFRRQVRSIPRVGVRVGAFHMIESVSSLIFIDYVAINIVSMLVAYS